jgi:hypothetical protein
MATCFNRYSTEARVAREGFGRLPRVATQAVLKDHRHSRAPRIIHIEDRRSCLRKRWRNRCHEFDISSASL